MRETDAKIWLKKLNKDGAELLLIITVEKIKKLVKELSVISEQESFKFLLLQI
jgi:hypothetical protein